jgi:hypothetical protein
MMSAKVAGTTLNAVRPTRSYTNPRDATQSRATRKAALHVAWEGQARSAVDARCLLTSEVLYQLSYGGARPGG